jgi:hypothetical protein
LDDGSQLVIQFFPKSGRKQKASKDSPSYKYTLTTAEGRIYRKVVDFAPEEAHYGQDHCDVHFGKSEFVGDFQQYHIFADVNDSKEKLGADITLTSTSKPFRPATGYFEFGENGDYYTWLCAVPSGDVTGTITYNGKTSRIHGVGYHDHQWGSVGFLDLWNHWTWARQKFDDYTLLLFDMTASKKYGFTRFPIIFVEDSRGDVVFTNTGSKVDYKAVGATYDPASKKNYPDEQQFSFTDGEERLSYTLTPNKSIENMTPPQPVAMLMKLRGINISYQRYLATGEMNLTDAHAEKISRTGELIYEFMYPGAIDFRESASA